METFASIWSDLAINLLGFTFVVGIALNAAVWWRSRDLKDKLLKTPPDDYGGIYELTSIIKTYLAARQNALTEFNVTVLVDKHVGNLKLSRWIPMRLIAAQRVVSGIPNLMVFIGLGGNLAMWATVINDLAEVISDLDRTVGDLQQSTALVLQILPSITGLQNALVSGLIGIALAIALWVICRLWSGSEEFEAACLELEDYLENRLVTGTLKRMDETDLAQKIEGRLTELTLAVARLASADSGAYANSVPVVIKKLDQIEGLLIQTLVAPTRQSGQSGKEHRRWPGK